MWLYSWLWISIFPRGKMDCQCCLCFKSYLYLFIHLLESESICVLCGACLCRGQKSLTLLYLHSGSIPFKQGLPESGSHSSPRLEANKSEKSSYFWIQSVIVLQVFAGVPSLLHACCDVNFIHYNYGTISLNHWAISPHPRRGFWFACSWAKDFEPYFHAFIVHFCCFQGLSVLFVCSFIMDFIYSCLK